jgi:predicted kinase
VLVVGPTGVGKDDWAERLFPEGTVLSLDVIRERIGDKAEDAAATADTLVKNVVAKRLEQNRIVVVTATALTPEERMAFVLVAQGQRRSSHLVLLDANKEAISATLAERGVEVSEETLDAELAGLAATRKVIMSGALGKEGFSSAIMLTKSVAEKVQSVHLGRIDVHRS